MPGALPHHGAFVRLFLSVERGGGAAVDEQVGRGEVAGLVGEQERGGVREFTSFRRPRNGHRFEQGVHLGMRCLLLRAHRSGHHARRDRAHPAALRPPRERFAADEALDSPLGPGVGQAGSSIAGRASASSSSMVGASGVSMTASTMGSPGRNQELGGHRGEADGRSSGPHQGLSASRTRAVPMRSTPMMAFQSAMVGEIPAAWATARKAPISATWALSRVSCSASVMSATQVTALPSGRSRAADRQQLGSRSTRTRTSAMSSNAAEHARPMPLAAPVMTATRPGRLS